MMASSVNGFERDVGLMGTVSVLVEREEISKCKRKQDRE